MGWRVGATEERLGHEYAFDERSILKSLGTADFLEECATSPTQL